MESKLMMHTRGLVTGIDKNGDAIVVMDRKNACGGCGSTKTNTCNSCLSGSKIQAKVLNTKQARKGDIVSVSLSTSKILKGAAALYLIPVAGILLGAFIGAGFHETLSMVTGFIGLVIGFFIVRLISERMNANEAMTPVISSIIYAASDKNAVAIHLKKKMNTCTECK